MGCFSVQQIGMRIAISTTIGTRARRFLPFFRGTLGPVDSEEKFPALRFWGFETLTNRCIGRDAVRLLARHGESAATWPLLPRA